MRIHKQGHEIRSVEEWFKWARPKRGKLHWKDNRSAKELARSWFRAGIPSPPEELRSLLTVTYGTELEFEEAVPECVVELDDYEGETRNCDLVVVCKTGARRIVVSVEAKADEPFGSSNLGAYYDAKVGSTSNVPNRIRHLSNALFGREPDEVIRGLRYQLVHAAAASLVEANNRGGELGLLLVHEFVSEGLNSLKLEQNHKDWVGFVKAFPQLAEAEVQNNQILGPISVPGGGRVPATLPLYLGKLVSHVGAGMNRE